MSDKPGIPSWQRAQPATPQSPTSLEPESTSEEQLPISSPTPTADEPKDEDEEDSQTEKPSLLEQATKFLEDETIRDAPWDKKIAFLRSKGVQEDEIEKLQEHAECEPEPILTTEGEQAWPKTTSQPSQSPPPTTHTRVVPPIVTYPEFLTQPASPPPLVTTRQLLTTAYATGGLMSAIYGLSQYVISPMTETLAETRHDFASHTQGQLEELNKRLGSLVSIDPANKIKAKASEIADDVSEADSDPTELFHRDFGTQTTPSLSRRPSVSSGSESEPVVAAHENRLKILTSHLRELQATRSNDAASSDSLKTKLSDLNTYLSEMSYQNNLYSGMGSIYGSNYGTPKTKDGKDDQIEVLKSDIRAVKGVLLSARNFPAGGRNTPPVGRVS